MALARLLQLLLVMLSLAPAAQAETAPASIDDGVRDAFFFAYPLYQTARTRAVAILRAEAEGATAINRFRHRARMTTPKDRLVTTPNVDTLYSAAWLDLGRGPVSLQIPALGARYHSVALLDMFTDHFAVLGTRTQGGKGGPVWIAGPNWTGQAPAGVRLVRAPMNDAWAIVRVEIDGPADLPAAAAAQAGFVLQGPSPAPHSPSAALLPPLEPDAATLLEVANQSLARGPLPAAQRPLAASLQDYGIGPGAVAWAALPPAVRESWQRQLPALVASLAAGFAAQGTIRNGWSWPDPGMGDFGSNAFYRAAVALGGLAALPSSEAVYATATVDAAGTPLSGQDCYQLTLPADVPANAFWSVTMYEDAGDGRQFLMENPLNRYAIGSKTPGLLHNSDNSLTLLIQHVPPVQKANWLPAPAGSFRLTFRAFLPDDRMVAGTWVLPGLVREPDRSRCLQTPEPLAANNR